MVAALGSTGMRGASQTTQVRGGTGIFTGRPAYVGPPTRSATPGCSPGSSRRRNTITRPFNPDTERYKPQRHGCPGREVIALARDQPGFQVPAVVADATSASISACPGAGPARVEFIYNGDVNGVYYINANLPAPRPRSRR